MALQRFNSVGGGSTSGSRGANKPRLTPRMSASSLSSPSSTSVTSPQPTSPASPSRSSHLVALRYEETVQAKPPIMVTKRSGSSSVTSSSAYLARSRSTLSTRSLATTASSRLSAAVASSVSMPLLSPSISPSSTSTASPSPSPSPSPSTSTPTSTPTSTRYPLVILRPPGLVVPPTEQHPALRTPTFHPIVEEGGEASEEAAAEITTATTVPRPRAAVADKGTDPSKRDSILASSAASTVSLWPEDAQETKEETDEGGVNDAKDIKDVKNVKEEAHAQLAEDEDEEEEEDDGYSSCMCRTASRRSKVVSVVCPALIREAPLPPVEKPNAAELANEEGSIVPTSAAASRVAPVEPATTSTSASARPSLEAGPVEPVPTTTTTASASNITREKSWRLPRTSFSFRASTFQRNSKKKKRSASLDMDASVPPANTPVAPYEDGLIPVVVPGGDSDTGTAAHENEDENRRMGEGRTTGSTGAGHILPVFTAQSPLLPAGPFQFSGAASATAPHQHARLSKPNPSWPPMLASQPPSQQLQQSRQSQQPAPPSASASVSIAPSCFPLGTNTHLPPPSMPLPSISSFASFPTPSLPYIPAIESSSPLSSSTPPLPQSPPPAAQPHFFLRVLSMSESRQKRQQQQQQDRDAVARDANPKKEREEKNTRKVTKRERKKSTDVDHHLPSTTPLISTAIPDERLLEDDFLQSLTFSKRGSLMFGGKRAVVASSASTASFAAPPLSSSLSPLSLPPMDLPLLAPAVERESLQVRSLYASGPAWDDGRPPSIALSGVTPGVIAEEAEPEEAGRGAETTAAVSNSLQIKDTSLPEPQEPQEPQEQPQEQPKEPTLEPTQPPDVSSLSIAPTDHLRPDAAARATASNKDARTSIISAASATTASTGIALTEGTESSLSLVPTTTPQPSEPPSPFVAGASTNTNTNSTTSPTSPIRNAYELAGGLEDWEDVDVADVDRFGFIHVRRQRPGTAASSATTGGGDADADADGDEQTVNGNNGNGSSGSGGLASGIGRHFSRRHDSPSARRRNNRTLTSNTSNGIGARSVHTSRSTSTTATAAAAAARSSIRAAANQLPHNKDRRWIDEAGEMLTLEPGLADIAEDEDAERLADMLKRKEWERAEKWRRMAKTVHHGEGGAVGTGAGMDFEFDLQHPKLVERTWKGIPDRWRAPAWYSFLASSAQRRRAQRVPPLPAAVLAGEAATATATATATAAAATAAPPTVIAPATPDGGETDTQIIAAFHRLQDTASPDDVQIDLDVPRTVNGHVMFRKRYRGGQRLLFRVLHALSLYFHATGYVQGMASLAATLLCYYDEERCFVMLVRLFHLRGLERLYEPGFGGLMEALGDFEQQWLARSNRRVAHKLTALNIDATTFATRWYLTLFNLSVPFPAQLRIWDVFMLLGDADDLLGSSSSSRPGTRSGTRPGTAATTRPSTAVTDAGIPPPEMTATAMITASAPAPTASKANLAILHAASTALIDGLQEVLLDADFENAMKAVTSWVPIKDEDLLMKVVHAEWKRYQKRKARR